MDEYGGQKGTSDGKCKRWMNMVGRRGLVMDEYGGQKGTSDG